MPMKMGYGKKGMKGSGNTAKSKGGAGSSKVARKMDRGKSGRGTGKAGRK